MFRLTPALASVVLAVWMGGRLGAAAQGGATCDAAEAAAAFRAGSLERLEAMFQAARQPRSSCPAKAFLCSGRLISILYRNKVLASPDTASAAELATILTTGRSYGAPWQLLAAEGDLEFSRGVEGDKAAYGRASLAYDAALNDLAEEPACAAYGEPGPPPVGQTAGLRRRASEAKLLAPTFQLVRTRDGRCGGVFLTNVRGLGPVSTLLPIEFDTDSTVFTSKGRDAADALVECAIANKAPSIRLTGHADERGPDDHNVKLSLRRLKTVEALLIARRFTGRIVLEPKGKREPYRPDDPGRFSQEDILQLNRRVEVVEGNR